MANVMKLDQDTIAYTHILEPVCHMLHRLATICLHHSRLLSLLVLTVI